MQALNLFPAGFQLRHHVVEVAAQVADFVVAIGEADRSLHVAQGDARDLVLQLHHGSANGDRQHHNDGGADKKSARSGNGDNNVPLARGQ